MQYELPWEVTDLAECFFYHTMEVPPYGLQRGQWDLRGRFIQYVGGVDVEGARVLDVGCASGYLSFSAEEAGASEVVAFDMDTGARQHLIPFAQSKFVTDYECWVREQSDFVDCWKRAFWLAHRAKSSKVKVHYGDVYNIDPALGKFDVVIVGAILEHLRDPFGALCSIAKAAVGKLIINTAIDPSPDALAKFVGRANNPEQNYTWWVWSKGMYQEVLKIIGFANITMSDSSYYCELEGKQLTRTAIVASRV